MTPAMITKCEQIAIAAASAAGVAVYLSGQAIPSKASYYVRFNVLPSTEAIPVALGRTSKSRNVGLVQFTVYGPRDRGAGATGDIADALSKAFHRLEAAVTTEGGIVFKDRSVQDVGAMGEQHIHIARIPYRYDFNAG